MYLDTLCYVMKCECLSSIFVVLESWKKVVTKVQRWILTTRFQVSRQGRGKKIVVKKVKLKLSILEKKFDKKIVCKMSEAKKQKKNGAVVVKRSRASSHHGKGPRFESRRRRYLSIFFGVFGPNVREASRWKTHIDAISREASAVTQRPISMELEE